MKHIRIFHLKNCHFLVVKFSICLNRRVFVMEFHANCLLGKNKKNISKCRLLKILPSRLSVNVCDSECYTAFIQKPSVCLLFFI